MKQGFDGFFVALSIVGWAAFACYFVYVHSPEYQNNMCARNISMQNKYNLATTACMLGNATACKWVMGN